MTENEIKVLRLIGIAKKAGKVLSGAEQARDGARKQNKNGVKLLLCSADASPATLKRMRDTSEYYNVPLYILGVGKSELAGLIGNTGEISVVGITDEGFAKAMIERIVSGA